MTITVAPGLVILVLIYCCDADFVTVPSPPVLTVTLNERHVYMCNHSDTIKVIWKVNGSRLSEDIFPTEISTNIKEVFGGGRVTTLEIGGHPEHNSTTIQCLARLANGSTVMTSNVSFFIQGSVYSLERWNETILWKAPFSLHSTIVYCVEVYNITCGRAHIVSDCDVINTSYTSEALQSEYIYEYTVTPRSNVEGAQNGTSTTKTERFIKLQLPTNAYSFKLVSNVKYADNNNLMEVTILFNLETQKEVQMFNLVYAGLYSLILVSDHGNPSLLESTVATRNDSSIMLVVSLPYRMLWNFTVIAYYCEEHPLSTTNELTTHDFQNISVTSSQPGEVKVSGDFIDGSTAIGVLIIAFSTSDNIFYHLIRKKNEQLHIESVVQGVVGGEYSISLFVVEESGRPVNRSASTPKDLSVENGTVDQPSIEYSLQSNGTGVFITCTFQQDRYATDCVAVVHQQISHLSSSGLVDIESSHKFPRSCDTASGYIPGVNKGEYTIGVFTWMERESKRLTRCNENSNKMNYYYFLLVVVPVLLLMLCCVCLRRKMKMMSREDKNGLSININNSRQIKHKGRDYNGRHGRSESTSDNNEMTLQTSAQNGNRDDHLQDQQHGAIKITKKIERPPKLHIMNHKIITLSSPQQRELHLNKIECRAD